MALQAPVGRYKWDPLPAALDALAAPPGAAPAADPLAALFQRFGAAASAAAAQQRQSPPAGAAAEGAVRVPARQHQAVMHAVNCLSLTSVLSHCACVTCGLEMSLD